MGGGGVVGLNIELWKYSCPYGKCVSAWVMNFSTKERNIVAVGVAAVFWAIWRARNARVFYHVYPHDPIVVMYSISNWIEKWSIM